MKKRYKEFQQELSEVAVIEQFELLSAWFQQWAMYISKGGDRPPRPHG